MQSISNLESAFLSIAIWGVQLTARLTVLGPNSMYSILKMDIALHGIAVFVLTAFSGLGSLASTS